MTVVHFPGQWSQQWAKAEERYWHSYCRNAGICAVCGERAEQHEPGCRNAPEEEDNEPEDEE